MTSDLYNSVKNYEKLVNKYPFNAECRKHLYSLRGRFRRRRKYEEKMSKQNIYVELGNCMDKNPKTFWKLINKLDNSSSSVIRDPLPHDEFKNHFKKLSAENAELSPFQQNIVKNLEQLKNNPISNPLYNNESSIKSCEIIKAIKSLNLLI